MGEDFALRGHWSNASMVKQALACRRRLKQKTMLPTMPRMDWPLGFIRLREEPLQKAGHAGILNRFNALKGWSNLRYAVVLPGCK